MRVLENEANIKFRVLLFYELVLCSVGALPPSLAFDQDVIREQKVWRVRPPHGIRHLYAFILKLDAERSQITCKRPFKSASVLAHETPPHITIKAQAPPPSPLYRLRALANAIRRGCRRSHSLPVPVRAGAVAAVIVLR